MDETHNAEAYWICGVVVDVSKIRTAQAALTEIAEQAAEDWDLSAVPELHGYDLFQREGGFEDVPPRACIGIYANALDVIAAAEPEIVLRGVQRARIKYLNPHRLAWRYAIESVDELKGESPILVVADEHAETEEALRGDIRDYMASGTGGWKSRTIENVMPELRFFDSRTNPLLQGADLVAFLHQRRFNVATESDARSHTARELLWAKVALYVAVERIWEPP
jgi:hypothetical protein